MAHDVFFSIPSRQLGNADIEFSVKSDGEKVGTLTVSKGSVVWFPKGTSYGYKVGWKKFDAMMRESASRFEKR